MIAVVRGGNTDEGCRIEEFKSWVASNSDVPEQHYIALTAQGKPVRFQVLSTEVSWSHQTAGGRQLC